MKWASITVIVFLFIATSGYSKMINAVLVQDFFYTPYEITFLVISSSVGGLIANFMFHLILRRININQIFIVSALSFVQLAIVQSKVYNFDYMLIIYFIMGFINTSSLICCYYLSYRNISSKGTIYSYIRSVGSLLGVYFATNYYSENFVSLLTQFVLLIVIFFCVTEPQKTNNTPVPYHNISLLNIFFCNKFFFTYYLVFFMHEIMLNTYLPSILGNIGFPKSFTFKCILLLQMGKFIFAEILKSIFPNHSMSVSSVITIILVTILKIVLDNMPNGRQMAGFLWYKYLLFASLFFLGIVMQMRNDAERHNNNKLNFLLSYHTYLAFYSLASILSTIIGITAMTKNKISGICVAIITIHVVLIFFRIFNNVFKERSSS